MWYARERVTRYSVCVRNGDRRPVTAAFAPLIYSFDQACDVRSRIVNMIRTVSHVKRRRRARLRAHISEFFPAVPITRPTETSADIVRTDGKLVRRFESESAVACVSPSDSAAGDRRRGRGRWDFYTHTYCIRADQTPSRPEFECLCVKTGTGEGTRQRVRSGIDGN